MRTFVLLAALAAGFAVAADGPLPVETPRPRPGLPNVPITRACDQIEEQAQALVEDAQRCDLACELVSLEQLIGPDSCVAAFQCLTALPPGGERAAFIEAARALDDEKRRCGECATVACRPPEDLEAQCVEGQCEVVTREQRTPRRVPPLR